MGRVSVSFVCFLDSCMRNIETIASKVTQEKECNKKRDRFQGGLFPSSRFRLMSNGNVEREDEKHMKKL